MTFRSTFESILVTVSFTRKQNQKSRQTELLLDFLFSYTVYTHLEEDLKLKNIYNKLLYVTLLFGFHVYLRYIKMKLFFGLIQYCAKRMQTKFATFRDFSVLFDEI